MDIKQKQILGVQIVGGNFYPNIIRTIANFFLYFSLKVHLKISLNPKFQNFRVTR
jgi:hypothetical protein